MSTLTRTRADRDADLHRAVEWARDMLREAGSQGVTAGALKRELHVLFDLSLDEAVLKALRGSDDIIATRETRSNAGTYGLGHRAKVCEQAVFRLV